MNVQEFGFQHYPTPASLAEKMIKLINWKGVKYVLDPSAGQGSLLDAVRKATSQRYAGLVFNAIELDPALRMILSGKEYRVLGDNFLTYSGLDQFDVILMNPSFMDAEHHLLKALSILYSGQIVCVMNAQTLKNPYSQARKHLIEQLDELGATVTYLENEFLDAERKTEVEIALIHVCKEAPAESDIFQETIKAKEATINEHTTQSSELVSSDRIEAMVQRYETAKNAGIQAILDFDKNSKHFKGFLNLFVNEKKLDNRGRQQEPTCDSDGIKAMINGFLDSLRTAYWSECLDDEAVTRFLTSQKKREYRAMLAKNSTMEFNESNLRHFMAIISKEFPALLHEVIMQTFERMTRDHAYYPEMQNNKTYLDNCWKGNNAFKINPKVVLPNFRFVDSYTNKWANSLYYSDAEDLNNIDKCMSYFDSGKLNYTSLATAIDEALKRGDQSGESTYFKFKFYKKGTLHITFKDKDLLRLFNVEGAKGKGFLPHDYDTTDYEQGDADFKQAVEVFEGREEYSKFVNQKKALGSRNFLLKIAA